MSTRGQRVTIPILGMNNQLLNDQSLDGLCDSIVNLKPKGSEEQPYWAPFEKINSLENATGEPFTYEFGLSSITDAFWQTRNQIGEFAEDTDGSLKRLLVLCQNESRKCIDIIEPTTWTVIKTQALPQTGTYTWSCTRSDQVTVIAINKDKKPFLMYYLIDDAFIPAGWPEMPEITFSTTTETLLEADVTAGSTKGVMRKDVPQYLWVTWTFKLFDGTNVKHNKPILVEIASGSTLEAVKPVFTLDGYGVNDVLEQQPFWEELIRGISVCATIPRIDKQEAIDDGAFFELGYWPFIDELPPSQWPTAADPNIITVETKSENWPVLQNIGIDNFTHHKIASRVLDTYNKRILLGGSSVDFILPDIPTNASLNLKPGGVYSQYMDFAAGSGDFDYLFYDAAGNPLADGSDPNLNYETLITTHVAQFSPKTGREFKAVTILESDTGAANVNPPGGPTGLPNAQYLANINVGGQLNLDIIGRDTDFGGGKHVSGSPFMKIKVDIGPVGLAADQSIVFTVRPSGTTSPFFQFSDVDVVANDITVTAKIYHRITIKTDAGTYFRILTGDIATGTTIIELPELIWYPDRRATRYELIVENAGDFEVALDKQLNQHPESNYSYIFLSVGEQDYTIGDSLVNTTAPNIALNLEVQYVPNRVQASISGNAFIFDPIATYRVGNRENDTILGFAINLNPTSEGQAGQYPVYAFSDKGIWALEQTGDPTIAFGRISPVSNFNGINNPYAYCNAQNLIIATDNKYIYALAGLEVKRIDLEISNDPDYKDYLKQIRIGYHRASDYEEVIFSNPFYDYSLCYNMTYRRWYKATERFKFFFYDYPELMGLTVDNALKDFSNKDEESPVAWSLVTRVIQYKEPYVFKKLYPFYIRMNIEQALKENVEDYFPFRMRLKGFKDDKTIVYNLIDQTIKSNRVYDPRIYTQWGSMYAYQVLLDGTSNHKKGNIQWLDTDMEYRYQDIRRRHTCSNEYLFTIENSQISLCCSNATGKNFYVYPGYINEEEFTIPASVHGFSREPDVTLRDIEGYTFEAPVRVHPTTFDITILVQPSIPYRVLLT